MIIFYPSFIQPVANAQIELYQAWHIFAGKGQIATGQFLRRTNLQNFLGFRKKSSEEQALLPRAGPRKNEIAKLEKIFLI